MVVRFGGQVEFVCINMMVFNGQRKGQTLHGGELYGGYSVSMSGDGLTLAVGHEIRDSFYGDDDGGQDWCLEGSIRMYTYIGTVWSQKGQGLLHWNEDVSRPMSLSADGNVVAAADGNVVAVSTGY